MEVRWRLFARDVLSLLADDAGGFRFGRPPRPVRGLRLLGVVVHREGGGTFAMGSSSRRAEAARAEGAMSNGRKRGRVSGGGGDDSSGDGSLMEGEFGLLGIGESTGTWQSIIVGERVRKIPHRGGFVDG